MRKIIVVLFLAAVIFPMKGQTAKEFLISMPESSLLTLSITNRLDLIDLYEAGQDAKIMNQLDDTCFLLELRNDYLLLQEGKNSLELIVLRMINDSKIICLIQTVCAPVCDSQLEFYTEFWKKINTASLISPVGKLDFIKAGINLDDPKIQRALIPLDIDLIQFRYDPLQQKLLQYYNTPEYLSPDDKKQVKPYLEENPRVFIWNGIRFDEQLSVIGEFGK